MTDKYEQWDNYETFQISHWIDNHREQLDLYLSRSTTFDNVQDFADFTKDAFMENIPMKDVNSPYYTVLIGALNRVNWMEIAEHITDKAQEMKGCEI